MKGGPPKRRRESIENSIPVSFPETEKWGNCFLLFAHFSAVCFSVRLTSNSLLRRPTSSHCTPAGRAAHRLRQSSARANLPTRASGLFSALPMRETSGHELAGSEPPLGLRSTPGTMTRHSQQAVRDEARRRDRWCKIVPFTLLHPRSSRPGPGDRRPAPAAWLRDRTRGISCRGVTDPAQS